MTKAKLKNNRVAIIGGASKGLGFACAESLAAKGIDIVITGRTLNSLELAKQKLQNYGVQVYCYQGDMSEKAFNELVVLSTEEIYGSVDILVNNSGGPPAGNISSVQEVDWYNAFESVLMYNIRMTKLVLRGMKNKKWGRIVNIASLSVKEPAESLILSNVFRAGVLAFSKSISKDLISNNITINNILPGAFKTDRALELIKSAASISGKTIEQVEKENTDKMPMKSYLDPSILGETVAFLCSDAASGITGTSIPVDGGISNGII